MSNASKVVSKLVIESYKDKTYSGVSKKFHAPINPENVKTHNEVQYHAHHIGTTNVLSYGHATSRTLSFTLLFDNTGIIPGSNRIGVDKQLEELDAICGDQTTRVPNYLRVIWGEIDFKGRLKSKTTTLAMFQVDGTLARAQTMLELIEEVPVSKKGQSDGGKDAKRAEIGGASAQKVDGSQKRPDGQQETFQETPDGPGAYSGAPKGAYQGGADEVYHGAPAATDQTASPSPAMLSAPGRGGKQKQARPGRSSSTDATHQGTTSTASSPPTASAPASSSQGGAKMGSTAKHPSASKERGGAGMPSTDGAAGKEKDYPFSHVAHGGHNTKKRRRLDFGNLSAHLDGDSLKDVAEKAEEKVVSKLSFWQRAKLFATKVILKYKP